MKKLLSALVALALCSGLALATVPDPSNCQVYPCDNLGPPNIGGVVLCPGTPAPINASNVVVTVKNSSGNIIAGASIVVAFGSPLIVTCAPGAPWTGTTDGAGEWRKNFNGGGCFVGANGCRITANGVDIRLYSNVKSPDWNGAQGDLAIIANDFANFLSFYVPGTTGCHDYDNNGTTNLGDLIIFADGFNPSHTCP